MVEWLWRTPTYVVAARPQLSSIMPVVIFWLLASGLWAPSESEPSLIQDTMTYGAAGAGVGACIGALEAAWMVNPGPTPFRTTLTLMGGHAAMFGSIAAVFAATEATGHMINGRSDANTVAAGCAAGSLYGLRNNNFSAAFAGCLLFGGAQAMGVFKSWEGHGEH